MRTPSSPTAVEIAKDDTAPAYLVRVAFDSGTNYFCTRGDVSWDGQAWLGAALVVSLSGAGGQLAFTDADRAIHSLVFGGAFKSRAVDVWALSGSALADDDPLQVFSGITAGAESAQGRVNITLQRNRGSLLQSPRQIIGPGIGVNHMPAPGTEIAWGGKILVLESANG